MTLSDINREIVKYDTIIEVGNKRIDETTSSISSTLEEIDTIKSSVLILSSLVEKSVMLNSSVIEDMVNRGLLFVFGKEYEFKINHTVKNNKNVFYYTVSDKESDVSGGIDNFGGGVMAVISFIIRFAVNLMDKRLKVMMMDESLNHVSEVYQNRLSEFISSLCKEFDYTIVLVTHQPKLSEHADNVIRLYKDGSVLKKQ